MASVIRDPSSISERIGAVMGEVVKSFDEGKYIDRENTFRHPDEEAVLHILSGLRQVVFQGFYAKTKYKVLTAHNHLSMLLEDILYVLARQTALVLPYDSRRGPLSEEEAETQGMELALAFLETLPRIRSLLETDLEAAFDGDPAACHRDEIIFSYPGYCRSTPTRSRGSTSIRVLLSVTTSSLTTGPGS